MKLLAEQFTTLVSKLANKDLLILSTLYIYKEENVRGFTYSEIVELSNKIDMEELMQNLPWGEKVRILEKEEITSGNAYRIIQKLVESKLVEKSVGEKTNEVYYSINKRGEVFLELFGEVEKMIMKAFKDLLIKEGKDFDRDEVETLKVEYWTPNGRKDELKDYESLLKHWNENRNKAYRKNSYRFYKAGGRHTDILINHIETEDQLHNLYFGGETTDMSVPESSNSDTKRNHFSL